MTSSIFRRCKANSSDEGARIRATDTPQLAVGRFILGKGKQIDIVVKDGDDSLSIEVKARMSSGQFLCSYPPFPNMREIWVFVDMFKKNIDDQPDYYLVSAQDLFQVGVKRSKEIESKAKARGKKYADFSSCDVSLKDLQKYNKGWDLVRISLRSNDEKK